ncbi:carbohydrate ABC transporter permease [Lysinibacter sp. HNR]|uniref:carbohydrate ABC transporter permease n=1 Tax=Lysinibacter sp. HNR TaxID=3031408 RepID=UPI002434D692|nr:carbohydrate ABC transporter permease [Lysinibacter sp. HNR]WGD37878.1 carbohydrate ABC transporter permease [Lysinibacter sp. HNR]
MSNRQSFNGAQDFSVSQSFSDQQNTRVQDSQQDLHGTRRTGRKHRSFGTITPVQKIFRYVLLAFVLFITIGPFLWQLSTSLKGPAEDIYTGTLSFIPSDPTINNYTRVLDAIPVLKYIVNSLIVAAFAVGGNVFFSTIAGFAIARLRWRGRKFLLGLILATLILPAEATIVSQFVTIRDLGLADTLLGVALPGMVAALNILLMYNAFRMVPEEIDQAAVMDGANAWQRLIHVGLPSVRGTIAVVAIFSFIGAWDDFLWPLIVLTTPDNFTLTIGLQYLSGTFSNDQRLIAAGTMIAFIPIAIFFAALQRYFFRGVEEGGVKG